MTADELSLLEAEVLRAEVELFVDEVEIIEEVLASELAEDEVAGTTEVELDDFTIVDEEDVVILELAEVDVAGGMEGAELVVDDELGTVLEVVFGGETGTVLDVVLDVVTGGELCVVFGGGTGAVLDVFGLDTGGMLLVVGTQLETMVCTLIVQLGTTGAVGHGRRLAAVAEAQTVL